MLQCQYILDRLDDLVDAYLFRELIVSCAIQCSPYPWLYRCKLPTVSRGPRSLLYRIR